MAHKWDKQYNKVFGVLVFIGVGLCVGGVFIAALLIPGGVFLAGALGMYASAFTRMYAWREDDTPKPQEVPERPRSPSPQLLPPEVHPQFTIMIDDHHIEYSPHFELRVPKDTVEVRRAVSAPSNRLTLS